MLNIDPYASGVLVKDVHERIVADIGNVARDASIKPSWIWTSLGVICDETVIDWVRKFRQHAQNGTSGLCFTGKDPDPPIADRMAAIAGALIRNFVRPKVLTLNSLLDAAQDGEIPDMSCVLVPNFFVGKAGAGKLVDWKVQQLYDALTFRHTHGLQTVLYVTEMDALAVEYGLSVKKHIEAHYTVINT